MKAMLIAPYNGMAEISKQLTLPSDVTLTTKVANLEDGAEYAKQAENEGYDILISRGGTASAIEQSVSLPVIHIEINGYDMLRVFTLIKQIDKKVALVGFSSITGGAATLCNILEYDIEVKTVHSSQDVKPQLEELKRQGFQVIMGDVITVQVAESLGLQGVLITSGKEALMQAIEEGRRAFLLSKKIQHNFNVLHQTFEHFPYPVAIVNQDTEVIEHNAAFISAHFSGPTLFSPLHKEITELLETGENRWAALTSQKQNFAVHLFRINPLTAGVMFYPPVNQEGTASISVQYEVKPLPLIGDSTFTKDLKRQIKQLSLHLNPIYITGAPGTGRSALAILLHVEQFGHQGPIVSIDGAAFNREDLGSLLHTLRPFEKATVLMQHLDKMDQQLQDDVIQLIRTHSASFQMLLIMDHPPSDPLADGEMIHLLPLASRKEDIPAFLNYFLTSFHAESGNETLGIKPEALQMLQEYHWPGNLIELRQTIHELSRMSSGYFIEKEQVDNILGAKKTMTSSLQVDASITLKEMEKRMITQVLNEEDGNQSKAAKRLGINRSTLWRKLSD